MKMNLLSLSIVFLGLIISVTGFANIDACSEKECLNIERLHPGILEPFVQCYKKIVPCLDKGLSQKTIKWEEAEKLFALFSKNLETTATYLDTLKVIPEEYQKELAAVNFTSKVEKALSVLEDLERQSKDPSFKKLQGPPIQNCKKIVEVLKNMDKEVAMAIKTGNLVGKHMAPPPKKLGPPATAPKVGSENFFQKYKYLLLMALLLVIPILVAREK